MSGAPPQDTRLNPVIWQLGWVSFLQDMSSEMIIPRIPLFLTITLRAPVEAVGLIEGIAESVGSLGKVLFGWISDRAGARKPFAVFGYGLSALSKPAMALAGSWPFVLVCRFADRVGKGVRTAPRDALIAENSPVAVRGRAFGLHRSMDTAGAVVGPLIGYLIITFWNVGDRTLFLLAGIPALLSVTVLAWRVTEKKQVSQDQPSRPRLQWSKLTPRYRRFLLIVTLFSLGNSSDAFLILRARAMGVPNAQILLLYAMFNTVEASLAYAAGKLSDRLDRRTLIIGGYLLFASAYLGMAIGSAAIVAWLMFLLYGGYYTLTNGIQRAFAADNADPERRATEIGAYHTCVGTALLPASLIAGVLYQHFGSSTPFYTGGIIALLCALLLTREIAGERRAAVEV